MVDPIQIMNNTGNITIQGGDLTTSIFLIIATFGGVAVAVIGVWYSNKNTKRSNELVEIELKSRLRPWISIGDFMPAFVLLHNGTRINYPSAKNQKISNQTIQSVLFEGVLTNVGSAPSTKIIGKWLLTKTKIQRSDFDNAKEDPSFILMPNETYPLSFSIPMTDFVSLDITPYYEGMQVFYQINEKTIGAVGKIFQIKSGRGIIEDYWYEEHDLV